MFKKLIPILPQIIASLFLTGFMVFAWQEPSQAPPGGNVASPLNVGNAGQSKEGGLILNTSGAEYGLIVDKGKLKISGGSPGAGKVLMSDENGVASWQPLPFTGQNFQDFQSSGSFTVPSGVAKIIVEAWGGGGGGGSSAGIYGAGGGGGGGYGKGVFDVSPGQIYSVAVGGGGGGGYGGTGEGDSYDAGAGGFSSFGILVSAGGGGGGGNNGNGGAGGNSSALISMPGGDGASGSSWQAGAGGSGGNGGAGGAGAYNNNDFKGWLGGSSGSFPGGGGGGGGNNGHSGANGRVIVWW